MGFLSYLTDLLSILLVSLPLIVIGKKIGPDSKINFGRRIPKHELESPKGIKALKVIRYTLISSGAITLAAGLLCMILKQAEAMFWIMITPVSIAVIIIALELYKLHGNNRLGLAIVLITIGITIIPLLLLPMPAINNKNKVHINNDTLFIDGEYSRIIPLSEITSIEGNTTVPPIKLRTNGTALGSYKVGYFLTEDNVEVVLYLYSDKNRISHIKTKTNEDIYINLSDSLLTTILSYKQRMTYRPAFPTSLISTKSIYYPASASPAYMSETFS